MKRICTIIIGLFISVISFAQPSITGIYFPQYMQGSGTLMAADDRKVPFACRITINGLNANTTYRSYNRFVSDTSASNNSSNGDGTYIVVKQSARFYRMTAASLSGANTRYVEFKTDPSGSYTGWFAAEASSAAIFTPGNTIYFRLMINDGTTSGTTVAQVNQRITATNYPITVINFGPSTTLHRGTGIRSTPATSAMPRNFVMLYDNAAGTGRPIAGTFIENDTTVNTVANGFVPFYANHVDGVDKAWGSIIPNDLTNGIQKIVQYSLVDGSKVGSTSAANGVWPAAGGGTANTVNSSGADTLVLDGAAVPLAPPASQTISFGAIAPKTYGDGVFSPGATSTSNLPVVYTSSDPNVAVIIDDSIHIKGVGTTEITAEQPGNDDFLAATPEKQTLIVGKKDLIVKPDDKVWLQGAPMPDLTITYTGFVYGEDSTNLNPKPKLTTTATDLSPDGPYPINADSAGSSNYNFIYQQGTLTKTTVKQTQTITFNAIPEKTYGDADFNPRALASSTLPVTYTSSDPNVATVIGSMIHIVGTGTTTITASQGGNLTYHPAPDSSQLLTVKKATLSITAKDTSRLFRQPNPSFRVVYSGFVNGEGPGDLLAQPVTTTTAGIDSLPGTYPISVNGAASNNYEISYVNGTLTIVPLQTQIITFAALPEKKYGDADFRPNVTASSGLTVTLSSSNPSVATIVEDTIIRVVGVGSTNITASQPGDATRAPAPEVTRTLNVQKANLIVSANDLTKNEGQSNPALTITYSGFVNGDDANDLTTLPELNTGVTTTTLAGTYSITIQGATSSNYNIQHRYGVFTVLPAQGDGQNNLYAYMSSPSQLQVNVYAVNTANVSIQLFDLNGTRLVNTAVTANKGFNTYRIPVGNLTAGIYNVRVAGNGVMLKTKVIIRP